MIVILDSVGRRQGSVVELLTLRCLAVRATAGRQGEVDEDSWVRR
jgi:hypothetical protein